MNSLSGPAVGTAALLLQGARTSSPVMIPGAFERHASASGGPGGNGTSQTYTVTVSARERLVYQREGGGAPSERSGGRPASILQKLWRSMRSRASNLR
jgi:hypothetical protein